MREKELRDAFKEWYVYAYDDPNTLYLEELGIRRGRCIVDVVYMDEVEFIGVELKTKYDTLKRLPKQLELMSTVFDHPMVCMHEKHLPEYSKMKNTEHVNLFSYNDAGEFELIFRGIENPKLKKKAMLELLWVRELLKVMTKYDVVKEKNIRKHSLCKALGKEMTLRQVRFEIVNTMKNRVDWRT